MVLSLIPARAHSRHPQPASSHPIHSSHKHTSSGQAVCWHKWEQARGHVYSQCSPSHPSLPTPSPSQLLSQSLIPTVAVLPSIPFQPCTLHQLPSYSISASSLASVSTILHSLFHPSQFLSPWPDPSPCSSSSFSPSPVFLPISFPIPISMFYCRFSPLPHLHLHLPPSPSPGPGLLPFQLPNAVVPTGRGHCPQRPLHESALQGLNPHTPRASAAQNLPWVESPLLAGAERAGPDWAASQVLTPHRPPSLSLWAGHHAGTSAHSTAPHRAPVLLTCLSLLSPLNSACGGAGKGGLGLCWGITMETAALANQWAGSTECSRQLGLGSLMQPAG